MFVLPFAFFLFSFLVGYYYYYFQLFVVFLEVGPGAS